MKFEAADGTEIKNYGVNTVEFKAGARRIMCSMKFNVADVRKPLAAVSAMVDAGNRVVFEKRDTGSYVENLSNGERIYLERKRGVYGMKVGIVGKRHDTVQVSGMDDEAMGFRRQA